MVLQVEEPSGALDVGEGFRTGHFLPLEHLARAERPFELAHEIFQVVLHDAIERHQVAVDVIQDFNRGGLGSNEVKRGTAGKDFDIAFVRRKKRNEVGRLDGIFRPSMRKKWDRFIKFSIKKAIRVRAEQFVVTAQA